MATQTQKLTYVSRTRSRGWSLGLKRFVRRLYNLLAFDGGDIFKSKDWPYY